MFCSRKGNGIPLTCTTAYQKWTGQPILLAGSKNPTSLVVWSVNDDLTKCFITGYTKASGAAIHVHHIFGGSNKTNSEKYHFLIPLRADWHDMASYGIHFNRELELKIKRMCQDYWLIHYGTKEEFIAIFGKWW